MNMDSDFSDDVLEEFFKFVESLTPPEFLQERKQSISQIPLRFTSSPIQQITSWLKPLNMDKYAEKFVEFGFYDPLALLSIMTDDLLLMGVEDKQEQQIILEAVKALTEKKEEKSPEKKDENVNSAIFSPYRTRSAHAKPPVAEIFSPKTKLQKSKSLADVEEAELNGGEVSPVPSTPSTPAPALPESVESRPRGYDNTKYKSGDISKFKQAIVNFRRSSEPSSEAALNPPNIVSQTEQIERLLKRLDLVERTVEVQNQQMQNLQKEIQQMQLIIGSQNERIQTLEGGLVKTQEVLSGKITHTSSNNPVVSSSEKKIVASPEELVRRQNI